MFISCFDKSVISSNVSGFRAEAVDEEGALADKEDDEEKNSSSPIVSSACVYRSTRNRSGGQNFAWVGSASIE